MGDLDNLTIEELGALWIKTIGECRYYDACDCPNSWKRERAARLEAAGRYEKLRAQYGKLGIVPPKVP